MGAAFVVVLLVVIAFAYLAAKSPEQAPAQPRVLVRALSQTDGVPHVIAPESRRRLARGSTAPALASLSPARMLVGELKTRRLVTPTHDEGWELLE